MCGYFTQISKVEKTEYLAKIYPIKKWREKKELLLPQNTKMELHL